MSAAAREAPDYGAAFAKWRVAAGRAWDDYTSHEFVARLGDGTLPQDSYLSYLKQDYVFLFHFARAWALAAAKAETLEEMRAAAGLVSALVDSEMSLHVETCAAEGIDRTALLATEEAPANLAYTRYVLEAGYSGDFLDLMAALAPCVLGYGEIGARLAAEASSDVYADWIGTYGSEDYQANCRALGGVIDAALARRCGPDYAASPRMAALAGRFKTATRLEVGVWDMGLAGA